MAITIGATTLGEGTSTAATSFTMSSFTPNSGAQKRVIAVGFAHTTVATAIGAMTATFGGAAMTLINEFSFGADPNNRLGVFEHDIGSSTTAGAVVFTVASTSSRWLGHVFNIIDVPAQTPVSASQAAITSLTVSMASAGFLLSCAGVNTDDAGATDNIITIDASQTAILNTVRGAGTTTEGRLSSSYKTVASGSQSGANSSPFSDGTAHIVVGWQDSIGGGVSIPAILQHLRSQGIL